MLIPDALCLGCPLPGGAYVNPETALDDSPYFGCWTGLLCRPPVGYPCSDDGGPYSACGGTCKWTKAAVSAWDGPYIEDSNVKDFWQQPYVYDSDYYLCQGNWGGGRILGCPASSQIYQECQKICGDAFDKCNLPPGAIRSAGPDKIEYTCDDVAIKMTIE